MTPELHRPVVVDRIGPAGLDVTVQADAAECAALTRRMQVPAVLSLTCMFHLEREPGGAVLAHGHLLASVVQTCVVSAEDFTATVEDRFTVRCVAEGEETEQDDPDSLDEITYAGGVLDLGEATAEQLALALDPYPHAPDAELPELPDEAEPHPFAPLAGLRRRH
jgi:uncharacterized metal-binding protein YceD (DUF177 family)